METTAPSLPRRRRRPRTAVVLLTFAALLASSLVVAAVVASRSYGPLVDGSSRGAGSRQDANRMTWVSPYGRGVDALVVDARKAGTISFHFDLVNDGRLPVTLGKFTPDDRVLVLRYTDLQVSRNAAEAAGGGPPDYVPTEGVVIEPGQHRTFLATVAYDVCAGQEETGSWSGTSRFPISYGWGPFSKSNTELPFDLAFVCDRLPPER
jgi:hypothetical protein